MKAIRYVELDYLCHMSSEVLIASGNMTKARLMPKWRLTDAKTGRTKLTIVAVNPLHYFRSWIALGERSISATPKKCTAPNLQSLNARISWEIKRSLASPATFVPRVSQEITGVVSTSGHCHLGESIDTIFAPYLQVEQSHDAETFGNLRAFSFRGTNEHAGRRRTHTECSIPERSR